MNKKNINVTIFRNLKEDNYMSTEIYANNLIYNLPRKIQIKQYVPKVLKFIGFLKYLRFITKHLLYPINIKKYQSDINHVIDNSYGHLINYLDKNKTIITCTDFNSLEYLGTTNFLGRQLFKYYLKGMIKAKRIIAISEHTKEDILKYTDYPPEQIRVIYDGYDKRVFKPLNAKSIQHFKNKNYLTRYIILLHVGSQSYKNTLLILQALLRLRDKINNLLFIKIGTFNEKEKVFIQKNKLQKNIKIFKNISDKDLAYFYNISDVLLFPSFHEGFGLPPLEAMACGCPVIVSNTSSLPEVVGNAGLLIDPKSISDLEKTILKIVYDVYLRNLLIQRGLKRAKLFSWKKCAKETAKVYEEIKNY